MHPAVEYHEKLAPRWAEKYESGSFTARARALLGLLNGRDLTGQAWLDAGCGSGTLTCQLARHGCAVTGVDASDKMVSCARQSAARQPGRFSHAPQFQVIPTIESLDWADAGLDGVLCASVLEYVDHPNQCLAEFVRVLRPGGLLLVSVANRRSLYRRAQKVCFWVTRGTWPAYLGFSKNEYDSGGFLALLQSSGMNVLASRFYGARIPDWLGRARWAGALLMVLAAKR